METVPNGSFQGDVPGFSPDTERVRCEALGSLVQNSATANSAEAYLYSSPQKNDGKMRPECNIACRR